MRILLNGTPREIESGLTLLGLLARLGLEPRRVAVAINATVVPRHELDTRQAADGDRIEVIEAVGGG